MLTTMRTLITSMQNENSYQLLWFDLLLEPEVTRLLDLMTSKMSRNVLDTHKLLCFFLSRKDAKTQNVHSHKHTLLDYQLLHFIKRKLRTKMEDEHNFRIKSSLDLPNKKSWKIQWKHKTHTRIVFFPHSVMIILWKFTFSFFFFF